jgi:hypothetical protein
MRGDEDYSTLPEEFENKRWKCSINREESDISYEYAAITHTLKYDCENKETSETELVTINSHKEYSNKELYELFGDFLNEQLEVLDRLNDANR